MIKDRNPPLEVLKYHYRKLFKLSAEELEEEPVDQFYVNLYIHALILERQAQEMKHGAK